MATNHQSPCPGACTEGAMCPACFREWQAEASAASLRDWLRSFGESPAPANDVRREIRLDAYGLVPSRRSGITPRELIQL